MKHKKDFNALNTNFKSVYDWFKNLPTLSFDKINSYNTLHVIVDMINGFVKEGALSSCEVLSINDNVAQFTRFCRHENIQTIALADEHTNDSTEFSTYPVHCLKGTAESALTDEIANADKNIIVFGKNSTNGYLEPEVSDFIKNSGKRTFPDPSTSLSDGRTGRHPGRNCNRNHHEILRNDADRRRRASGGFRIRGKMPESRPR